MPFTDALPDGITDYRVYLSRVAESPEKLEAAKDEGDFGWAGNAGLI
jgi:hypothetical protein